MPSMRLTHMWPRGCKLTVSRVVRTEADQGLVRIARGTAWPGHNWGPPRP